MMRAKKPDAVFRAAAKSLRARERELAKTRDKLRNMIDDLEQLEQSADEAREAVETAIDVLSQYV